MEPARGPATREVSRELLVRSGRFSCGRYSARSNVNGSNDQDQEQYSYQQEATDPREPRRAHAQVRHPNRSEHQLGRIPHVSAHGEDRQGPGKWCWTMPGWMRPSHGPGTLQRGDTKNATDAEGSRPVHLDIFLRVLCALCGQTRIITANAPWNPLAVTTDPDVPVRGSGGSEVTAPDGKDLARVWFASPYGDLGL